MPPIKTSQLALPQSDCEAVYADVRYVPSAQKQLKQIRNKVTVYNNNLNKLWEKEGKTGEFPLAYPE